MNETPKIVVQVEDSKIIVSLHENGKWARQLREAALNQNHNLNQQFVQRWQRTAINGYYDFQNDTGILI